MLISRSLATGQAPTWTSDIAITPRRAGKNTRAVEQFNVACPVGTPVVFWPGAREGEGRESATRSAAWLLGGHTPVVMVDHYPGGIALSHVMIQIGA